MNKYSSLNFERLNKSTIINLVVGISKSSENISKPDTETHVIDDDIKEVELEVTESL